MASPDSRRLSAPSLATRRLNPQWVESDDRALLVLQRSFQCVMDSKKVATELNWTSYGTEEARPAATRGQLCQ